MNQLNKNYTFTLIVILLAAAVIRLAGWYGMPYHHDELSALSRLHFSSWSQLFSQGIMVDGHPALVQCFLYVWTGLFGTAEWIVKIPFVLCGIATVYLSWKLAYKWASPQAALLSAAFMAVLELPAFYSVLARPYAPGILLMVWFALVWTRWCENKKPSYSVCAQYVIAALLCGICHHFTALGALLLGVYGLFAVPRINRTSFLLVNAIVVAGYLTYLPVTLAQLKFGGLGGNNGWLGIPENDFTWKYIQHMFMYSVNVYAVFVLAVFLLYFRHLKAAFSFSRFRIAALIVFAAPLLIGILYSVYVSPVIQFSLLVFFIPFFFIFLFGEAGKNVSEKLVYVVSLFIVLAGAYTLTFERKYFLHTHTSVFRDAFTLGEEVVKENRLKNSDVFYAFNDNATYHNFYNKNNIDFTSYLGKENQARAFTSDMRKKNKRVVVLANPSGDMLSVVKARYKNLYSLKQSFTCEIYVASDELLQYADYIKPKQKQCLIGRDGSKFYPNGFPVTVKNPYAPDYKISLKEKKILYSDFIEVHAVLSCADSVICNATLVADLEMPDGRRHWVGSIAAIQRADKKYHAVILLRGQDVTSLRKNYLKGKIHTYVWNQHKQQYTIEEMYVATYAGNPLLYAGSSDIQE